MVCEKHSANTESSFKIVKKVLLLSRYGFAGASSRMRFIQFIPFLEKSGFNVTISPFFDDNCINRFYKSGKKTLFEVAQSFLRRFLAIKDAKNFDVIWLEKEAFPLLPSFFESLLFRTGVPYIVDYDDAIFHDYDTHKNCFVRSLLGEKLNFLICHASAITAGNSYLADYMTRKKARRVELIPTVVDIDRYYAAPETLGDEFRIGWIGTPATSKYLTIVKAPLEKLSKKAKIRLVAVGSPPLTDFSVPLEQHNWSEENEPGLLSSINVGIMPLLDSFWERGKCGYKLIQYMASGRSVIASPVGVNVEIVKKENGLLTNISNDNWFECFEYLMENIEERRKMGIKNRLIVEQRYSLQVQKKRILDLFSEVV